MKIYDRESEELLGFIAEGIRLLGRCGVTKNYGYVTFFDARLGRNLLVTKVSMVPADKLEKYNRLSQEKASRLFANTAHVSSFQSRNEKLDRWAGAIRCLFPLILSFSGLPELADEALMIYVAYRAGWINAEMGERIAQISDNPYIVQMID